MSEKVNAKLNDVFGIPIANMWWGLGKIVEIYKKHTLLIAVFKKTIHGEPCLVQDVLESDVVLLGLTQDGKLYHGHWPIVGNDENDRDIERPCYLIGPPERCLVEDFFGEPVRKATLEDQAKLIYRKTVAPIRFENALQAFHNVRDWDADYDSLLFE